MCVCLCMCMCVYQPYTFAALSITGGVVTSGTGTSVRAVVIGTSVFERTFVVTCQTFVDIYNNKQTIIVNITITQLKHTE